MMRYLGLVLSVLLFDGCAHSHLVSTPPSMDREAEFNERNRGRRSMVHLRGGDVLYAPGLELRGDSLTWRGAEPGTSETVSVCTVERVQVYRHGRGAAEGLGLGVAAGAAIGAAVMLGIAVAECEECLLGPGFFALAGAAYGTLAGAPTGLLVGVLLGHREDFVFGECGAPGRLSR